MIGLASMRAIDVVRNGVWEVPVELPRTASGTIVVYPAVGVENISGGGGVSDVHTFFNSEAGKAYLLRMKIQTDAVPRNSK